MKGKKAKKIYFSGYVDFGILGRKEICIFGNNEKKNDNQPSLRIFVKENDAWKEVGALWMRELKGESKEKECKKKEGDES
ncbi:MAG: DUF736 family protein [Archaeoglobaceae archaeon]